MSRFPTKSTPGEPSLVQREFDDPDIIPLTVKAIDDLDDRTNERFARVEALDTRLQSLVSRMVTLLEQITARVKELEGK